MRSPRPEKVLRTRDLPEDREGLNDATYLHLLNEYDGLEKQETDSPEGREYRYGAHNRLSESGEGMMDTYDRLIFNGLGVPLDSRRRKKLEKHLQRNVVENPARVHEHVDRYELFEQLEEEIPQLEARLEEMRPLEEIRAERGALRANANTHTEHIAAAEHVGKLFDKKKTTFWERQGRRFGIGLSEKDRDAVQALKSEYGKMGRGLISEEKRAKLMREMAAERAGQTRRVAELNQEERELGEAQYQHGAMRRERTMAQRRILGGVMKDRAVAGALEAGVRDRLESILGFRDPSLRPFDTLRHGQEYFKRVEAFAKDLPAAGRPDGPEFLNTPERMAEFESAIMERAAKEVDRVLESHRVQADIYTDLRTVLSRFVNLDAIGQKEGQAARDLAIEILKGGLERLGDTDSNKIKASLVRIMIKRFK